MKSLRQSVQVGTLARPLPQIVRQRRRTRTYSESKFKSITTRMRLVRRRFAAAPLFSRLFGNHVALAGHSGWHTTKGATGRVRTGGQYPVLSYCQLVITLRVKLLVMPRGNGHRDCDSGPGQPAGCGVPGAAPGSLSTKGHVADRVGPAITGHPNSPS